MDEFLPTAPPTDAALLLRARAYLRAMPPSISGAGGHAACYTAAVALVHGFGLPPEQALTVLEEDFNPHCQPPWSLKELTHKIKDAAEKSHEKPRGWLRDAKTSQPATAPAPALQPLELPKTDPERWHVTSSGIFPMKVVKDTLTPDLAKRVAPVPINPIALARDVISDESFVKLRWPTHGGHRTEWARYDELRTIHGIHAVRELPVSCGRAALFAEYITDTLKNTPHTLRVMSRPGWSSDGSWVWPGLESGVEYIGEPWPEPGHLDQWKKPLAMFMQAPKRYCSLWAAMGLAAAAPLVRVLGVRSPILGIVSASSKGKSTIARYALSLWGKPEKFTLPASSTAKGIQDRSALLSDLPIFLEDLQEVADRDVHNLQATIYGQANGQRRVTSSRSQHAVGGETRYGCALYASERSLMAGLRRGAQLRVLEIPGEPLSSACEAQAIDHAIRHGGAMAEYLSGLMTGDALEDLKHRALRYADEYANGSVGSDRYSFAVLRVGLDMIGMLTGLELPAQSVVESIILASNDQRRRQPDNSREAIEGLVMRAIGFRRNDDNNAVITDGLETVGYQCESYLDIVPVCRAATDLLRTYGGYRRHLHAWYAQGWLREDGIVWNDLIHAHVIRINMGCVIDLRNNTPPADAEGDGNNNGTTIHP